MPEGVKPAIAERDFTVATIATAAVLTAEEEAGVAPSCRRSSGARPERGRRRRSARRRPGRRPWRCSRCRRQGGRKGCEGSCAGAAIQERAGRRQEEVAQELPAPVSEAFSAQRRAGTCAGSALNTGGRHAALRGPRQPRSPVYAQPAQHRFHGGGRDRPASWVRQLAAQVPRRNRRRPPRRRQGSSP